jgi:hypothetical protein
MLAEARPWLESHLNRHDSLPWTLARITVLVIVLGLHGYFVLGIEDRVAYNVLHPYTVALPLVGAMLLRNCNSWARSHHSVLLAMIGRHSLELYLLQVCVKKYALCVYVFQGMCVCVCVYV